MALAQAAHRIVELGRPPDDLLDVLVTLAIAGPGNVALRAVSRITGGPSALQDEAARDAAAHIAWAFRTLFNIPEVMGLVRSTDLDEGAYWRQVLDYCINGNLQAVMDEYLHVLPESMGIVDHPSTTMLDTIAADIHRVVALRAANYSVDDIGIAADGVQISRTNLRARFALRFGVRASDEEAGLQRSGGVRSAFNSPFWPFVLASTSLGQEGLDFHQYCHAVIHWNLPANPVDMEQREGRVHRFKGHAVRKNVARMHASAAKKTRGGDPWKLMFEAARPPRRRGHDRDLVPYWVYDVPGGAKIERYVPALPLSREVEKYEQLQRSLAAYRLVLGQPRQEDMVAFLGDHLSEEELAERLNELRIDLTPRGGTKQAGAVPFASLSDSGSNLLTTATSMPPPSRLGLEASAYRFGGPEQEVVKAPQDLIVCRALRCTRPRVRPGASHCKEHTWEWHQIQQDQRALMASGHVIKPEELIDLKARRIAMNMTWPPRTFK